MCAGDDRNCPDFEFHRQKLLDDLDVERRSFLKSAFAATGGAAALTAGGTSLVAPAAAQTVGARQGKPSQATITCRRPPKPSIGAISASCLNRWSRSTPAIT